MSWIDCDGYSWRLDNDVAKKLYTCLIKIPLPSNVNKKTLFVDFKSKHVTVKFKTKPEKTIIDRDLVHAIKVEVLKVCFVVVSYISNSRILLGPSRLRRTMNDF